MAPEHKFATAARLCQEVLGGAADGGLPLSDPGCAEVVGDALRVLASKDIKVAAARGGGGASGGVPDPDADGDAAAAAVGAARGRLVSQMMKKHLAEAVVPVLIELKRGMEAARHPLLGDLMAAAAAMLRDHKGELGDMLAADRQLAAEILYDIRRAEARAAEAAALAAGGGRAEGEGEEEGGAAAEAAAAAGAPAGELLPARTPCAALAARAGAGAGATPRTGGGAPGLPLPAGTSGTTPIAAEVLLRSARKAALASPGGEGGGGGAGRGRTPGSGLRPPGAATPRSGPSTPRSGGGPRTGSSGGRTLSRFAPAAAAAAVGAGPSPSPRARGEASPAVPRLRAGRAASLGGSRLRPGAPAGGRADAGEAEGGNVELTFAVAQPGGATPALWNVSADVAPAAAGGRPDDMEAEGAGAECDGRAAAAAAAGGQPGRAAGGRRKRKA
jgi:condensin-2 complex subunit D3